ncbi:MAG: CcmD family protein [Ktedonobacterales bacterium]
MNGYLVAAYAIVWVALLLYLGWLALRMRGVQAELETVRELVEARAPNGATTTSSSD